MLTRHYGRRGSYAPIFALTGVALIGFGALSVDLSMLRLADAEIQAVADATAHAAILQLRRTDDRGVADKTAREVVAQNRVAGLTPNAASIEFGQFANGVFSPTSGKANSVRVAIDVDVQTPFAKFWGTSSRVMSGTATAAVQPLHAIVVMDITNSWGPAFVGARLGALEIFDQLTAAAGDGDRIGLATFHNKYGVEYTPLQRTVDALDNGIREDWNDLRTAFRPDKFCGGDDDMAGYRASVSLPPGCTSPVPYEFDDEYGTDHAIGVQKAREMFAEQPDPSVYRAMIIVTDGEPIGVGDATKRIALGFVDDRWDVTFAAGPNRGTNEITSTTIALAQQGYDGSEIHSWLVSYKLDSEWLGLVPQGDGYFVKAEKASDLQRIFRDIAESLPVTLVE